MLALPLSDLDSVVETGEANGADARRNLTLLLHSSEIVCRPSTPSPSLVGREGMPPSRIITHDIT